MQRSQQDVSAVITRFRNELGVTQAVVAQRAKLDQSRISRLEKGELATPGEIERVLGALADLGSTHVTSYRQFAAKEWKRIEPPTFWNPSESALKLLKRPLERLRTSL
jgi:transcriptional regulator with XRE-family HTH domain